MEKHIRIKTEVENNTLEESGNAVYEGTASTTFSVSKNCKHQREHFINNELMQYCANYKSKETVNNSKIDRYINDNENVEKKSESKEQIEQQINFVVNNKNKTVFYTGSKVSVPIALKNTLKNQLNNNDNSGSAAIVSAVSLGETVYNSIKVGQVIENNLYKSAANTVKVLNTVDNAYWKIKSLNIKFDKETFKTLKTLAIAKINYSKPVQNVKYAIVKVQYLQSCVKYAGAKTVYVTKGILNGSINIKLDKSTINLLRQKSINVLKHGAKKTYQGVKYVIPKTYGLSKSMVIKSGDMLSYSSDPTLQTAGNLIKTARYTKNIGTKVTKTTVKTGVKTGKNIYNSAKKTKNVAILLKNYGVKTTVAIERAKLSQGIIKAGGSLVRLLEKEIHKLLTKVLVPVIIVAVLFFSFVNVIVSSGAAAYQVLFGWISTDKDTGEDIDEQVWLQNKIVESRKSLVDKVKNTKNNNLKSGGGNYDIVRFYNVLSDTEVQLTDENILACIYSESQYLLYIQPLFHTILLSNYDLEATQVEMQNVYSGIMGKLTKINTSELPMEWCNGGNLENDGNIHANIDECPNHSDVLYHADDISSENCSCDYNYYICEGHKGECICGQEEHEHTNECYDSETKIICDMEEHEHTDECYVTKYKLEWIDGHLTVVSYKKLDCDKVEHKHTEDCYDSETKMICNKVEHIHNEWNSKDDEGCYSTDYCSSDHMASPCLNSIKHKGCNGYYICNGHKVMKLTITCGDFSGLMEDYYILQIEELEKKDINTLTEEEQQKLDSLRENYEICQEYISNLQIEMSGEGNGNIVDLGDVTLTEVTSFACSFIGKPYIWGGTDPNVGADCSGFIQYVYAHFGISLPRTSREQVKCGIQISLSDAKPGDLIFYADDGVTVSHVAMYIGNGKIVHASNSAPYPQGGIKVSNIYGTPYKIMRVAQ